MTTIRALAALLCLTALACSVIIDIEECTDNSQCILEDGTQLVCGPDETCVEPPGIGEECSHPRECLEPLVCVAADPEQSTGLCTLDCTVAACEHPDLPPDWVCCELDSGKAACLAPSVCG
jgi:hypothetical protein